MRRILGFFFLLILLSGCSPAASGDVDENYILGAALTKLSKFIEPSAMTGRFSESTPTADILAYVQERDPSLLEPFDKHLLLVTISRSHAVVLVCLADSSVGLLEDAGCSPHMDAHLWQSKPFAECSFTLNVTEICEVTPERSALPGRMTFYPLRHFAPPGSAEAKLRLCAGGSGHAQHRYPLRNPQKTLVHGLVPPSRGFGAAPR